MRQRRATGKAWGISPFAIMARAFFVAIFSLTATSAVVMAWS